MSSTANPDHPPRRPRAALVGAVAVLALVLGAVVVGLLVTGDDEAPPTPAADAPAGPSYVDDPDGGLRFAGEVGEAITVDVTGDLPTGSATIVPGSGPALAAGDQALVDLWIGDAEGNPISDTYADRQPVVVPVGEDGAPYREALVGATVGTRYRVGGTVSETFGDGGVDSPAGAQPGDQVVVVVDVLGSVLPQAQGIRQQLPPMVPLLARTGRQVTGFRYVPGDGSPVDPVVSYRVRGAGTPLADGDDVALRTLVQDFGAPAPTSDGFADALPSAMFLDDGTALEKALVGVPVGSQVVVQLPETAAGPATIALVSVLAAG